MMTIANSSLRTMKFNDVVVAFFGESQGKNNLENLLPMNSYMWEVDIKKRVNKVYHNRNASPKDKRWNGSVEIMRNH